MINKSSSKYLLRIKRENKKHEIYLKTDVGCRLLRKKEDTVSSIVRVTFRLLYFYTFSFVDHIIRIFCEIYPNI